MARERPEGVFVVGIAVCPCTVCLLPSQGTSFKFADLAPHCLDPVPDPFQNDPFSGALAPFLDLVLLRIIAKEMILRS